MGLFFRKKSTETDQPRGRSRSSVSSETLASEMRSRARRRLIGALVLVVAAVIIVPMLLNTTPPQNSSTPTVVVPSVPPVPAPGVAAAPDSASSSGKVASGSTAASGEAPSNTQLPVPDSSPDNVIAGAPAAATGETTESRPSQDVKPEESKPKVAEKSERKESERKGSEHKESERKESEHKAATKSVARTDDGSVAIALLQGRQPPKNTASTQQGNFVLQIAAYTTEKDALARRAKLLAAGVTDAYIETAVSGGKHTYRLRVGPFQTRDAAQAAQTRLRALGYENGFISSK